MEYTVFLYASIQLVLSQFWLKKDVFTIMYLQDDTTKYSRRRQINGCQFFARKEPTKIQQMIWILVFVEGYMLELVGQSISPRGRRVIAMGLIMCFRFLYNFCIILILFLYHYRITQEFILFWICLLTEPIPKQISV